MVQTDEVLGETELSLHCRPGLLSLQGSPADRSVPAGNIIYVQDYRIKQPTTDTRDTDPGNVLIVRSVSRLYWSLSGSFLPWRLGGTQASAQNNRIRAEK